MTIPGGSLGAVVGGALGALDSPSHGSYMFDSGLPKPQRTTVRDGVIDLLQRLHVANGGYLQAIEPSATLVRGPSDENAFLQLFDELRGRAPAVFVTLGDKAYGRAGDVDRWIGVIDVHVYVFVNGLRGRVDGRLAADVVAQSNPVADPGADVVLEHIEELVIARNAGGSKGAQIKLLRPKAENHIGTESNFELWEQIYTVEVERAVRIKRDWPVELLAINTYHRLIQQPATIVVTQETDIEP